jgi:DNA repair exonuclease SbcCD ATPase subunit
MKKQFVWSLLIIPLLLTGCGKSKLEIENATLKDEVSNLQQRIQSLQSENSGLTNEIEKGKQQIQTLEKQITESEQQAQQAKVKQKQMINGDLDKIRVRLQRVLEEPKAFAFHSKEQRDNEETRLRQVASSVKAEISDIIIELKNCGLSNTFELKVDVDEFFSNYDTCITTDRASYDYIDMGLNDSEQKKRADSTYRKSSQAANHAIMAILTFNIKVQ